MSTPEKHTPKAPKKPDYQPRNKHGWKQTRPPVSERQAHEIERLQNAAQELVYTAISNSGMSQNEVARMCNVSPSALSDSIRRKNYRIDFMARYLEATGHRVRLVLEEIPKK
jgi:ribosome-binding protein aMBF1 (putative translation factor)